MCINCERWLSSIFSEPPLPPPHTTRIHLIGFLRELIKTIFAQCLEYIIKHSINISHFRMLFRMSGSLFSLSLFCYFVPILWVFLFLICIYLLKLLGERNGFQRGLTTCQNSEQWSDKISKHFLWKKYGRWLISVVSGPNTMTSLLNICTGMNMF